MTQHPYHRLLSRATDRHVPLFVSVELTRTCNFACRHCYLPAKAGPTIWSTARMRDLLSDLKEAGTLDVSFTGGEALLHPDCLEMLIAAREMGFRVRLLTNASRIDQAIAQTLKAHYIQTEVSLYAMDPALFEEITQSPGSFAKVMAGIDHLEAEGAAVSVKMPVCRLNVSEIDAVAAFCAARGLAFGAYATLFPKTNGQPVEPALELEPQELKHFLCGPHGFGQAPDQLPPIQGDRPLCAAGVRYAFIDAKGDVFACNLLTQPAGNVDDKPFSQIWRKAPLFDQLRRMRRSDLEPCGSCPDLAVCGRCHALAWLESGTLSGPSPTACRRAAALAQHTKT